MEGNKFDFDSVDFDEIANSGKGKTQGYSEESVRREEGVLPLRREKKFNIATALCIVFACISVYMSVSARYNAYSYFFYYISRISDNIIEYFDSASILIISFNAILFLVLYLAKTLSVKTNEKTIAIMLLISISVNVLFSFFMSLLNELSEESEMILLVYYVYYIPLIFVSITNLISVFKGKILSLKWINFALLLICILVVYICQIKKNVYDIYIPYTLFVSMPYFLLAVAMGELSDIVNK